MAPHTSAPARAAGRKPNAKATTTGPQKGGRARGAESASAPAPGGRMPPPKKGVKVRMYRTGLGDCFLMAFPRAGAGAGRDAFYLLVDCGVYKGTPQDKNAPWVKE